MQDVILLTGAGQIGLAIARRMGHGKKIVVSDKNINNAQTVTKIMQRRNMVRSQCLSMLPGFHPVRPLSKLF